MNDIKLEGASAYQDSFRQGANPYRTGTQEAWFWCLGWNEEQICSVPTCL